MLPKGDLDQEVFKFGDFKLIPNERLLIREGDVVTITPKQFDTLLMLVENHGHLIEKDEFLDGLWPDAFVEEATLTRTISHLRKTLDESPERRYIETVTKRGYRFVADVSTEFSSEPVVTSDVPVSSATANDHPNREPAAVDPSHFQGTLRSIKEFCAARPVLAVLAVLVPLAALQLALSWTEFSGPNRKVETVAVLPFIQIGNAKRDEMLEFGLTDAVISRLSRNASLTIRSTAAIQKYGSKQRNAIEAGKELKVDAVLDGRIQREGGRTWVSFQLINTENGAAIWADRFQSESGAAFELQESIANRAAEAMLLKLGFAKDSGNSPFRSRDPDAYSLYVTGRFFWNKRTVKDLKTSIEYYERALKLDPDFAMAYAGLADCHHLLAEYLATTPKEGFTKSKAAARKALEIDDTLAEAHTSLAYALAFYDWKWEEAEKEFRRAIELDPKYPTAHQWYAEFLAAMGRFDEAKVQFDMAEQIDPTSLIIQTDLAAYYFLTRQFKKSIAQSRKVVKMDPNFAYSYVILWFAFQQEGMDIESANAFIRSLELFGGAKEAKELKTVLDSEGVKAMWKKRIDQINTPQGRASSSAMWNAIYHIRVGNKEEAMDWFEKSFQDRDRWIINLRYSPEVDGLRSNARFKDLVRRIGV